MTRRVRFTILAIGVCVLTLPLATTALADGTVSARFGAEAWYQPNPLCGTTVGCRAAPLAPTSAYPAGTLHVGLAAGQETARSYLTLADPGLPGDATVTAATLTIPLDTNSQDGSVSPDTSQVHVCTTTDTVSSAEGSFDPPPQVTCTPSVKAAYAATPAPHLSADLTALADQIAEPGAVLALVPADLGTSSDSWHVVFAANNKAAPAVAPPSLQIAFTEPAAVARTVTRVTPPRTGVPAVPAPAAVGFAQPAPPPAVTTSSPPASAPQLAPAQTLPAAAVVITRPYAYPIALLLPLAILGLAAGIGRLLTRDVIRPHRTTG